MLRNYFTHKYSLSLARESIRYITVVRHGPLPEFLPHELLKRVLSSLFPTRLPSLFPQNLRSFPTAVSSPLTPASGTPGYQGSDGLGAPRGAAPRPERSFGGHAGRRQRPPLRGRLARGRCLLSGRPLRREALPGPTPAPLAPAQRPEEKPARGRELRQQPRRRKIRGAAAPTPRRRVTSALWCLNVSRNSSSVAVSTAILALPKGKGFRAPKRALPGRRQSREQAGATAGRAGPGREEAGTGLCPARTGP